MKRFLTATFLDNIKLKLWAFKRKLESNHFYYAIIKDMPLRHCPPLVVKQTVCITYYCMYMSTHTHSHFQVQATILLAHYIGTVYCQAAL